MIAAAIEVIRPDHWFKNVFIVPGILLALFFSAELRSALPWGMLAVAFISACLVASSNYVLNEILDAEQDKHHPVKRLRAIPSGRIKPRTAVFLWIGLAVVGLGLGVVVNSAFAAVTATLWVMGLLYNVRPIRLKDKPYVDVLSEAINNPIRMAMGWTATGLAGAPPLSVIVAYWMFGAFLMAMKRFAEFRHIDDADTAGAYRDSFRYYNEERLLESIIFYAAFFAMMSGIFIARYCVRLVLATPMVVFCMAYYIHLGFKPDSPVQYPEHLFRHKKLVAIVGATFLLCAVLLFVPLPAFTHFFDPRMMPR